jgi:nucleotide-binding universal stress UspA family protein
MVGYDGSRHARYAGGVAAELAGRFRARLTIVVVRPADREVPDSHLESLVPMTQDGEPLVVFVESIRARALAGGAESVDFSILHGEVLPSILEWVGEHAPALVVVGSRGLSRGRRLLLGSISSGLVEQAPCPVLVVRETGHGFGSGRPGR